MSLKPVARRLLRYASPHKGRFMGSVLCFLLGSAVEPAIPALFKKLLDSGFSAADAFPLWTVPVVVIGLFALRGTLSFCGSYLLSSGSSKVVLAIRSELITALLRADAQLFSHLSPGIAVSKIINDPLSSATSITGAFTTIMRDTTAFVFLFGYLVYLNPELTLISMVVLPALVFMVRRLHKRLARVGTLEYDSNQRLAGTVDDITRAWRVIRTFDAADFERGRFIQEARHLRGLTVKRASASALMTPMTQIVVALGIALILTIALWQARQGASTIGEFVSFITALLMTISPMRHLTDVSQPILNGLVVARGCFELLDTPPEHDPGTQVLDRCDGRLAVKNLKVMYDEGSHRPALSNLTMDLPAGKTTALVGHSGAGKTTLINALLGFVSPTQGSIEIDGHDISTLTRKSLRRQFAVVSQDIVLFDGSIADNVAYAQDTDRDRVRQCLEAANLWDYVSALPQGMDAPIGTNGSRLSGGQRQRLAIARALYKDSSIWIFDEATSALDSESESVVQQSIERWGGNKTLILIAHRLSTVRKADHIHVMADGNVVESGTDAELRAQGGVYASMVASQSHLGDS